MFFIVEKCTRGEICHSIYLYAKANNKHMNDFDKNKEYLVISSVLACKQFI